MSRYLLETQRIEPNLLDFACMYVCMCVCVSCSSIIHGVVATLFSADLSYLAHPFVHKRNLGGIRIVEYIKHLLESCKV